MPTDVWDQIKHFSSEEFDSVDEPGSGRKMNIEFVKILDTLRDKCNFPFHINSGYRSPAHNSAVGGKPESAHMAGLAADITCESSSDRFHIVKLALENGIKRIGIANSFIHLDFSFDLPQEVVWLYPANGNL